MYFTRLVLTLFVFASSAVQAEDLSDIYQRALMADDLIRQAEYTHRSAREGKTQAILNLLPINLSAQKTLSGIAGPSPIAGTQYQPATIAFVVQVGAFSWDNWIALKQADHEIAQAEANYVAAQEDLIYRVATCYFAILSAEEALDVQQGALKSSQRQVDQAEGRFKYGQNTIADVESARSQRDSFAAAVLGAKRSEQNARDQLRAITKETYTSLAGVGENLPLVMPEPNDEESWVRRSREQNANLIASRLSSEIAHDEYLTAMGGHLPSVTISAQRSLALQNNRFRGAQQIVGGTGIQIVDTSDVFWSIGFSVPLFSAGIVQSRVRQAKLAWEASKSGYAAQLSATEEQARDAFHGILSQIAQVNALSQAVKSGNATLSATEGESKVGTKSAIDVVTARQSLVQAASNLVSAKYAYLNDIVALRHTAGDLDSRTLTLINTWLIRSSIASHESVSEEDALPKKSSKPLLYPP